MYYFTRTKILPLFCISLLLNGCGSPAQDVGTPATVSTTFSGLAIDGYLARATVFIDTNNNGTRDAWEPFAFTDNEGFFSFNPNTNTDYCSAQSSAQERQYCLQSNVDNEDPIIRIDGGYDILTGEPFEGQLSRRLDDTNTDRVIVSPLTTLMTDVQDPTDRATLLDALGIVENDLDVDYLDERQGIDANLLNTALKIHKTVSVLSDRLNDHYVEIGNEIGTPNDSSAFIYRSLANEIASQNRFIDAVISNNESLTRILDQAETATRAVYDTQDLILPTDLGGINNPEGFIRPIQIALNIPELVNTLVNNIDQLSIEDATGASRALESVIIKSLTETNTVDSSIEAAINFFTDEQNTELINAVVQSLSEPLADVSALANNDFMGDDFDSVEEITEASQLDPGIQAFTRIGGLQLRVSDLFLGQAPANLQDLELEVYFDGEADAIGGSFSACAKYIENANIDGTLGEGNTRGELVHGFWSLLGATQGDLNSYNLLLTIELLGANYQALMKIAGEEVINDINYQTIRFDNDGEFRLWHSLEGLVELGEIPTSNSGCIARLPSRVGL